MGYQSNLLTLRTTNYMMKTLHQKITAFKQTVSKVLLLLLVLSGSSKLSVAQCPLNLDFEQGDFTNWQCWTGTFVSPSAITLNPSLPTANRHEMLTTFPAPGNGLDPYGFFPQNCPNGSGHSIRLGNATGGGQAEGVSYTFTIPAGQNQFNLIYNYAVVLNDGGATHDTTNQPRLLIRVMNVTDNRVITCSSFPFIVGGGLSGFFPSPINSSVLCKDWAANSITLDGNAGKTIEIFFVTTDCGFTAHFGYAYIDLNTECSSAFIGATYCPDDSFINVTAPFGYQTYEWWNSTFTIPYGNTQTINFTPPPPSGTQIAVIIVPFNGYGCRDTLYANLLDTLTLQAQAGPDTLSCNNAPVQLGVNPRPTYVYSWSPPTGLSNPNISNPIATPSVTTQYVLTVTTAGGGCGTKDTVIVSAAVLDDSLQLIGPLQFCNDGTQTAVLIVLPADSIQWYLNNVAIPGANQTQYNVTQSGTYHATVFSFVGCSLSTASISFIVNPAPRAAFNTNAVDLCFKNHQFIFTNTSTITGGTMLFNWDLGDGTTATTTNINHSYAQTGTYIVKLLVISDMGCKDSIFFTVNVFASPVAGFTVNTNDQCFKNNQFVFSNTSTLSSGTMQYSWDMGDGNFVTTRDVTYSYAGPGTYIVKLLTTTDKGCADSISFTVNVNPAPVAGFNVNNAQQCFTNNLFNFTNTTTISSGTLQYVWTLGDGTTATTANVTHNYMQPGDYIVKMVATSDKGCADSSSFAVKVYPFANADFYVGPVCINLTLPLINKTINNTASNLNYLWDFGNGQTSTLRNPVYSYPAPGTYTISLSVNTNQCPLTSDTAQHVVVIDAPAPGITYAEEDAVFNFPEPLQARQIGTSVLWTPATSLDNRYSYRPNFRGINPQLYTIELKTPTGCLTVDTQMVKTHKKIEIYVPTVFTPGSSTGLNDYLRPLLMGFDRVNYFRIYNRWGKLLFQTQSDRPGWDGKVNGVALEMQTVVWMIEAIDVDGKMYRRQGTTVLMR